MDIFLTILGLLFISLGVLGAILPVLPGPPISWLGLLCINSTDAVPNNSSFLWITFAIAILITILDYVIPIIGTKKFGGSKYGIWGSTIGLILGLFFSPIGLIVGPFIGAFIGELIFDSKDSKKALKSATGSFIGFLFSTGLKMSVAFVYFYYFIEDLWLYKADLFSL